MKTLPSRRAARRLAASAAAFVTTALLVLPHARAQVNKCVDSSGRTVAYGTECPPGTRAQQTGIRNTPGASAPSAGESKTLAEQEAEFRKRQMEKQDAQRKADQKSAENAERAQHCDSARSYLKTLQSGMRVVRSDPRTGERAILSDADYPGEIASAKRAVEANCK